VVRLVLIILWHLLSLRSPDFQKTLTVRDFLLVREDLDRPAVLEDQLVLLVRPDLGLHQYPGFQKDRVDPVLLCSQMGPEGQLDQVAPLYHQPRAVPCSRPAPVVPDYLRTLPDPVVPGLPAVH